MRRAQAAYEGAQKIKALGFRPDIMIGHHGWGEMLNLCRRVSRRADARLFRIFLPHPGRGRELRSGIPDAGGAVRRGTVQERDKPAGPHARPDRADADTLAAQYLSRLGPGADPGDRGRRGPSVCRPDPAMRRKTLSIGNMNVRPAQKLVTYVARNLEPYRGFHVFMRALPRILTRPDVVVSIIGGDGISYGAPPALGGTWRSAMLRELGSRLDPARVHFLGKVPYAQHLSLLQRSDAHVYLSYPFVASWSLREALACGCTVIGNDTETVTEFLKHGENGRVVPSLDSAALAEEILHTLEDKKMSTSLRHGARAYAEHKLDLRDYLAKFRAVIEEVADQPLQAQPLRQVA